jgi:hypothetical protein
VNEHGINTLHEGWQDWRFVRQAAEPWPHAYRPSVRGGPVGTIIVAYAVHTRKPSFGRYWYVLASGDVCDGLQIDPTTVADPHGGIPVVPRTIHSNQVAMPYCYLPDAALATEIERRAAHVGYWLQHAKLNPAPKPQTPGILARLWKSS